MKSVTTEFQSATDNQALKDTIVSRIEEEGAISFREYMELALYHPRLGYYCSPGEKIGRRGDYMTSPEVSSVFGTLVGRQLCEMWRLLGEPLIFQIVEAGAGRGTLCRDVLWWARNSAPAFRDAIQYTIVERSEAMRSQQRAALAEEEEIRWSEELPEAIEGCLLSNELLDALPVHRVAVRGGKLFEVFVSWRENRLTEGLREPPPDVRSYFEPLGLLPGEGCTAEVNLDSLKWMTQAAKSIRRGFVMTFDYGYDASELYAPWRTEGTLLCFYRHNSSGDPYARVGRQDMTSHVDFTSLIAAGEEAGIATLGLTTQSLFCERLGIDEAILPAEGGDLESYYERRREVTELLDPAGLGRIKLLVQSKGVPDARLSCFGDTRHA
jgi:SAM-dependent MidA family methyltransferase